MRKVELRDVTCPNEAGLSDTKELLKLCSVGDQSKAKVERQKMLPNSTQVRLLFKKSSDMDEMRGWKTAVRVTSLCRSFSYGSGLQKEGG